MATANSINANSTGLVKYDGAGTFSGVTITQYDLLIGAASNGITSVAPSATSGVPVISQGAGADPTFGTAVVAGGGTGTATFNINGAVFSNTTTTGALVAATLTSGQLLIGGTTTPAAATLSAGTGVGIVNGNNSITINALGGGLTWTVITADQTAVINNGYIANKAGLVTITMPTTAAVGSVVAVTNINTAAGVKLIYGASGQIIIGTVQSTVTTGNVASISLGDSLYLVCTVANNVWQAIASTGNWTVA